MIAYTMLGTNDLDRAASFYDQVFAIMGTQRLIDSPRIVSWGSSPAAPMFAVTVPYNEQPATAGNGTMIAVAAANPEQVDALHAKAIELGATDEGAPGPRMEVYYCAYFRDLDGNKINCFCPA